MKHLLIAASFLVLSVNALAVPDRAELQKMAARFVPTRLSADISGLSKGDRAATAKLVQAAELVNQLFITQVWSGNAALYKQLQADTTPLGKARLSYYWLNKGPWSNLDKDAVFVPGAPAVKPPGANFYPEDMTKDEFEAWVAKLPKNEQDQAKGFFTVIHRGADRKLTMVPYSQEYQKPLADLNALLKQAAALTDNESLRKFLNLRADAFLSNDYYASDVAWMDMDAPVDVTIGPYEVYQDDIFNYKAAFEAYVNIKDKKETDKLDFFAGRLQEVENNLPIDPEYRNPKLGASSPIRVVNQVIAAGDGAHGVQTSAYNLPNDERVINEKGSKRVMLKNVQEAKFKNILTPISKVVLSKRSQSDVSFDSFFTHILAHELSHGIGPHQIKVGGRETTARQELKELHSAIEEAKADITGLFMLQYLFDHGTGGKLKSGLAEERRLYTTYLASSFRSLRFGIQEAHGKGTALQMNYFLDQKAFQPEKDGTFSIDLPAMKDAVKGLTRVLMTLEAKGDYAEAKKFLDRMAVIRPETQKALDRLKSIPTDIFPIAVTAEKLRAR